MTVVWLYRLYVIFQVVQEVVLGVARKENSEEVPEKLNVTNVFNKSEEVHSAVNNKNLQYNSS